MIERGAQRQACTSGGHMSSRSAAMTEELIDVHDALGQLSDVERRIALYLLQGYPQREIAQALGVTQPAISQRVSRIRAKLGACSL
ncbi:MAG: sigma-70 family RNA polymerase sigma factor [Anaerolineae bacterium]|nr:sigma-70 family RNA polymerase sigma factor [Anaerolineae bacterium]